MPSIAYKLNVYACLFNLAFTMHQVAVKVQLDVTTASVPVFLERDRIEEKRQQITNVGFVKYHF